MANKNILAGILFAGMMAACQNTPDDLSVAEYCANPENVTQNVCQLHVEINGTRTALADTDLRLGEARSMASSALSAARSAQSRADSAMQMAEAAMSSANAIDNLHCETRTINQTNTGSCPANYRLMSCTQTRYTTRAGGLSFLREIDDQQCRFNARVLEMQVRCCTVASTRSQTVSRRVITRPVAQ